MEPKINIHDLDDKTKELIKNARKMQLEAYCPYSHFSVGAALRGTNGQIYTGCNVETVAFSSICAERTAIVKAVSEGMKTFTQIAIVAKPMAAGAFTSPCGTCRQFLREFCEDLDVYLAAPDGDDVWPTTLNKLLPFSFKPRSFLNLL